MDTENNISCREALKRIGATVISGAVASSGIMAMAACGGRENRRVVLYFTGTGNCLYVARHLGAGGSELLSIPQLMKQKRFEIEADEIGIVYPIYGHMPPYMVRQFIERAKLKAEYKYAILTYGARTCDAVEIWDGISRKAGNAFDYINTLIMVDNWLPNFDMNEKVLIDKHIPENLEAIAARKCWHEPVSEEDREMHRGFMAYSGLNPEVGFLMKSEKYFAVTNKCIGCGACVAVCPRSNYELTAQGVRCQGDCEFCFACIQNCPQKAIVFAKNEDDPLLGRGEKNPNARYRN